MIFDATGLIGTQPGHSQFLAVNHEKANGYSWDNSPTGTGKTFVSLAIIRHLKTPFVVVCPKLAIPQWKRWIEKWGLQDLCKLIINHEKISRGNTDWYKHISADAYRKLHGLADTVEVPLFCRAYHKFPADWFIVIDECHKCRGVETLCAGWLMNLKRQHYKMHMLSATQATTPGDMRAFGFVCDEHDGTMKDFKRFQIEAGGEFLGKWGRIDFHSEKPESMAKLDVVRNRLFNEKKIGSRMKRSDFGDIFPKSQVVLEAYDMGAASVAINNIYNDMQVELLRLEERCKDYRHHILAIITKARRTAELLKVPTMVEMTSDLVEEGRSVVIFPNYTETLQCLYERLCKLHGKDKVGRIFGEQSIKERVSDIADFNADRKIITVANILAGGQCIDLHDLIGDRPRSSLINPSYSAVAVIQAAGRIDRAYAMTDVYQRFVLAAGTIEEHVAHRFHDRNKFMTALNDGTLTDADLIPTDLLSRFAGGLTQFIK